MKGDFPAQVIARSAVHADLETSFGVSRFGDWPDCATLNERWRRAGKPPAVSHLAFASQDGTLAHASLSYDARIVRHGLIATRPESTHDLFNALTWMAFPLTKLAIVRRQADRSGLAAGQSRSRQHNALALFDECGVVLLVRDTWPQLLHREHQWQQLFVEHRAAWWRNVRPVVFGHGLLTQCLTPYVGLTAKAWYVQVPAHWPALSSQHLPADLDEVLCRSVAGSLATPAQLLPLPVLGVPGWCEDNSNAAFYANTEYFRPRRSPAETSHVQGR